MGIFQKKYIINLQGTEEILANFTNETKTFMNAQMISDALQISGISILLISQCADPLSFLRLFLGNGGEDQVPLQLLFWNEESCGVCPTSMVK